MHGRRPRSSSSASWGRASRTALAAAPRRRAGDDRDRRADGSRARDADRRGLRARWARRPSASARPRSSARCSSAPTAARSRSAAAASSRERVREALGRHIVVWLQVDAEEAWRRIAGTRPAAGDQRRGRRAACSATRLPLYEELADAVVPPGDRGIVAAALPAIRALAELPRGDASCSGRRAPPASTRSSSAAGLLERRLVAARGPPLLRHRQRRRRRSTPSASSRSPATGRGRRRARGRRRWPRPSGCCASWPGAGMTREDHVVALGGGVVGDLAGFCAPLYQRGVPVVQVPTTLVAQVDSAYGGKTGVDLPEGKNYAGAYHLPAAVLADTGRRSRTLPPAELAAGFVEVAEDRPARRRRALGAGARDRAPRRRDGSTTSSSPAPATSARSSPPTSATSACAHVLNLGHTVGHAIEAASGYARYRHGEAIGSACWRRCGSPTRRACATRSRRSARAHGPAGRASTPRSTSTPSSTRSAATRSGPPTASASSCSPSPAAPSSGSRSIPIGPAPGRGGASHA